MKQRVRSLITKFLVFLAQRRLKQFDATLIGITGSVGKTSTKDAIYSVLHQGFKTKRSHGNMNTNVGLALSLLDLKSPYSSVTGWIKTIFKAVKVSLKAPVPIDHLILEMGVDKPMDMDETLSLLTPDVMVFLNVENVHLGEGQFKNRQAIYEEKSKACLAVKKGGWVILNGDDNFVKQLHGKLEAHSISVGVGKDCDVRAIGISTRETGLHFSVVYDETPRSVHMPNVFGDQHVHMALSAIAAGLIHGMPWESIEMGLYDLKLPAGRMNKIPGKNGSLIIDSSYNASPASMEAALHLLPVFPGRKIAALGSMNELGSHSEHEHVAIGKLAAKHANLLIAVGKEASAYAEGAQSGGLPSDSIHLFSNSREAGIYLAQILEKGDVLLVKGSQNNVRMERTVKACMKDPSLAKELLVRQSSYWRNKA